MAEELISDDRVRGILAECEDHAKGLTEFPSRLSDGPGAVSALYTSLSFADVIGLCKRALSARALDHRGDDRG